MSDECWMDIREALSSPDGESEVAEALATGLAVVVNRHTLSPGGLRWIPAKDLQWLIEEEEALEGAWALGTGFVVAREAST